MAYEVMEKEVPAQDVAAVRRHTSLAEVGMTIKEGFGSVMDAIETAGERQAGPPFIVFHDEIDDLTDGDIEICVPVARPFMGRGEVYGSEIPSATVASTIHRGPYDEIGPAYEVLSRWIMQHGRQMAGPPREVYLTDPDQTPDPEDHLTEVAWPIR